MGLKHDDAFALKTFHSSFQSGAAVSYTLSSTPFETSSFRQMSRLSLVSLVQFSFQLLDQARAICKVSAAAGGGEARGTAISRLNGNNKFANAVFTAFFLFRIGPTLMKQPLQKLLHFSLTALKMADPAEIDSLMDTLVIITFV